MILYIKSLAGDHPRLCGEKSASAFAVRMDSGSPPPMRGKASGSQMRSHFSRDHPRLCGEKQLVKRCEKMALGSPPPMRGKAFLVCQCDYSTGITPAYAGKSYQSPQCIIIHMDHPRLCGEKGSSKGLRGARWGSPLPMRGKAASASSGTISSGITPAYAGKSLSYLLIVVL